MTTDVVIVGGGIAGLACAVALADSGMRVTLLEKDATLGGRARSWTDLITGDVIDIGPHILLTEYRNMLRLLERLGTREQIQWQTDKLLTIAEPGRRIVMRSHRLMPPFHLLPSLLAVPSVTLRDKLSNLRTTWTAMKMTQADTLRFDSEDAERFLRAQGVTPRFIAWFWASVAMTILNVPLAHCSAGTLLGFYRHLVGNRRVRIGFPRVGLGDLFVPAAVREIEGHGGCILLRRTAKALRHEHGAVTGVLLDDGSVLATRHCVLAVPPLELQAILPREWAARDGRLRDIEKLEPSPYVSTYIWFDRKLTREPFWTRVWSPTNLTYDSYDLSNIRNGWAERPSVIASNIIYSYRAHAMSDEEIVRATVREIAEFLPAARSAGIRHTRVHRIPLAKLCSFTGIERTRPPARTPWRGLFLAGDWTRSGLPDSMESAVRSAMLAAEEVCRDAGDARRFAEPLPETEGLAGWVRRRASRSRASQTIASQPGSLHE